MDVLNQNTRREQWYQITRQHMGEYFNPDGSGKIPQFNPPWREPVWILPALYTGSQEFVDLANRVVERYNDPQPHYRVDEKRALAGKDFNIFQSNAFAKNLCQFGHLLTPKAREVMQWHAQQVFKTHLGAQQSDYKFHGANDNMPMMATMGNILGGEALGNPDAIKHGTWMLNQFRRLLSRSAWASEYNSVTYTPVTLSCIAKIATLSKDPEIRKLARHIEQRMWADAILHFHPGTKLQAGPQSRAYAVDSAGHTHSLHVLLWLVFGPDVSGRNPIQNCFEPDPREVMHFCGCPAQSIAEYTDFIDADFQVPQELADLMTKRNYPAVHHGRAEAMGAIEAAGEVHTTTYMHEDFSLGTVDVPTFGGAPVLSPYATYQYKPRVETFKDSGVMFVKYLTEGSPYGEKECSADKKYSAEKFSSNKGYFYTQQKENRALLLSTPHLASTADTKTGVLKLCMIFPAHFGSIQRSVIGAGPVQQGAIGQSDDVACVSVETGEVFIHMQPLTPTVLPCRQAVRWTESNGYQILEFVNYEGPERLFTRPELARVVNGVVVTIESKKNEKSLEEFHRRMSKSLITDYISANHRYFLYQRDDVEFEAVLTMDPFGVQTGAIDGRAIEKPTFVSNQIDVKKLPFMNGPVERNAPHFPWGKSMPQTPWPNHWLIGSRGLPDEKNYEHRTEGKEP